MTEDQTTVLILGYTESYWLYSYYQPYYALSLTGDSLKEQVTKDGIASFLSMQVLLNTKSLLEKIINGFTLLVG